jgi:tetratricopeptide (TPR) repeat protein
MAGSILGQLGRHNEALSILLECDKIDPGNYQTYYFLLSSFLSLHKMPEAYLITTNLFNVDWKSHTINTDMIELYVKTNHLESLISFYQTKLKKEKYDMEFRGHIQLHMAQAYDLNNSNINKKFNYLKLSRESFHKCYDESHPIFRVLQKMEK